MVAEFVGDRSAGMETDQRIGREAGVGKITDIGTAFDPEFQAAQDLLSEPLTETMSGQQNKANKN